MPTFVGSVVAYVPIQIVNSTAGAITTPFQQYVATVNPSLYTNYITYLNQINFQDGNGNILYSWLETAGTTTSVSPGTVQSTVAASVVAAAYWVKLTSPATIAAGATVTIYMCLNANSVWDGTVTGAMPKATGTYGQFDNGANVFSFYDNFAGTSLDTNKWGVYLVGTGTYTVNNGLTVSSGTAPANSSAIVYSISQFSYPMVLDDYWVSYSKSGGYPGDNLCESASQTSISTCVGVFENGTGHFYNINGTVESIFSDNFPYIVSIVFYSSNAEVFGDNYSYVTESISITPFNFYITINAASGNYTSQSVHGWTRLRVSPPNGTLMPSVSIGAKTVLKYPADSYSLTDGGLAKIQGKFPTDDYSLLDGGIGKFVGRGFGDNYSLTDKLAKNLSELKSDSYSLNDAGVIKSIKDVFADKYTLSDSIKKAMSSIFSDAYSLSDKGVSKKSGVIFSDSYKLDDSLVEKIGKFESDSYSLTDKGELKALHRGFADSYSLSDKGMLKKMYEKLEDGYALTDRALKLIGIHFGDSYSLNDSGTVKSMSKKIGDIYSLSDGGVIKALKNILADSYSISDKGILENLYKYLKDSYAFNDKGQLKSLYRHFADAYSLSDVVFKKVSEIFSDRYTLSDVGRIKGISAVVLDKYSLSDKGFIKSLWVLLSDKFVLADLGTTWTNFLFINLADGYTLTDKGILKKIGDVLHENITLNDIISKGIKVYFIDEYHLSDKQVKLLERFYKDGFTVSDIGGVKKVGKVGVDSFILVDAGEKKYIARLKSESVSFKDLVNKLKATAKSDGFVISDLGHKRSVGKNYSESVLFTDGIESKQLAKYFSENVSIKDLYSKFVLKILLDKDAIPLKDFGEIKGIISNLKDSFTLADVYVLLEGKTLYDKITLTDVLTYLYYTTIEGIVVKYLTQNGVNVWVRRNVKSIDYKRIDGVITMIDDVSIETPGVLGNTAYYMVYNLTLTNASTNYNNFIAYREIINNMVKALQGTPIDIGNVKGVIAYVVSARFDTSVRGLWREENKIKIGVLITNG